MTFLFKFLKDVEKYCRFFIQIFERCRKYCRWSILILTLFLNVTYRGCGEEWRDRIFPTTGSALSGRTIDGEGANVEAREHFRTCSQACLCDSRNPARPALELSFLPVKRKTELKSAFRNCAPSRKHPQGGKCKHALIESAVHQEEGDDKSAKFGAERKRKREMSVSSFSGFQALVAKSKINPGEASGALSSDKRAVCTRLVKYGEKWFPWEIERKKLVI